MTPPYTCANCGDECETWCGLCDQPYCAGCAHTHADCGCDDDTDTRTASEKHDDYFANYGD